MKIMSNTITTPESIPSFVEIANLFKGSPEKESALVHWIRPFTDDSLIPEDWWKARKIEASRDDFLETARKVVLTDQEKIDLKNEINLLIDKNISGSDMYFRLRESFKLPRRNGRFLAMKPFLAMVKNLREESGKKGKHTEIRRSKTRSAIELWDDGNRDIRSIADLVETDLTTIRTALVRHGRIKKKDKHEPASV